MKAILLSIWHVPRNFSILVMKAYQKTLSPDHGLFKALFPGGYCKFQPTCSSYAIEALKKYGFIKGWPKSLWRVMRCNPWSCGGIDHP